MKNKLMVTRMHAVASRIHRRWMKKNLKQFIKSFFAKSIKPQQLEKLRGALYKLSEGVAIIGAGSEKPEVIVRANGGLEVLPSVMNKVDFSKLKNFDINQPEGAFYKKINLYQVDEKNDITLLREPSPELLHAVKMMWDEVDQYGK